MRGSPRNPTAVLLRCLGGAVPPEFVSALHRRLEWKEVIQLAERLGTVSSLYTNLAKTGAHTALPGDSAGHLTSAHISSAARSIRVRRDLELLAGALSNAAIPVILLKGAALATSVYEHFTLRPMGDIDLLVERGNLDRAREAVLAAGYLPAASEQSAEWYRLNHHHDQPLRSPDHQVTVELHFHIIPPGYPFPVPIVELWERAQPVRVGNCPALVLSPEDLLLHSCIHLAGINLVQGQLRGLIDVTTTIRRFQDSLRWPLLVQLALRYTAAAEVYHTLILARKQIGAEVPVGTLRELRQALPCGGFERRLARCVFRRAVVHQEERLLPIGLVQEACRILLTRQSLWQKLWTASRYIFKQYVSTARVRCNLRQPLFMIYAMLVHPTMLLRKRIAYRRATLTTPIPQAGSSPRT